MLTGFKRRYVEVCFQWYKPPFDDGEKRRELLRRLNEIEGISLPADAINRRPSIPLGTLAQGDRLERLLAVMQWYLDEVRRS